MAQIEPDGAKDQVLVRGTAVTDTRHLHGPDVPHRGTSAQCRYQADTYIHAGWSTDLGVGPEVGGAVLNRYVAAATSGVRSLALIS